MRKLRFLIPVLGKLLIMFRLICLILVLCVAESVYAGKITLKSVDRPAEEVFAEVMRQSGKNFIYSSDILRGLKVRVDVKNKSLGKTLRELFKGTDIEYKIKGDNILLMRRKKEKFVPKRSISDPRLRDTDSIKVGILRDVIVDGSRNKTLAHWRLLKSVNAKLLNSVFMLVTRFSGLQTLSHFSNDYIGVGALKLGSPIFHECRTIHFQPDC